MGDIEGMIYLMLMGWDRFLVDVRPLLIFTATCLTLVPFSMLCISDVQVQIICTKLNGEINKFQFFHIYSTHVTINSLIL